jgi:hypothetical protein
MSRFFASPGKTSEADLVAEIDIVSKNEVVSGLLHSISGLLAILDEKRRFFFLDSNGCVSISLPGKAGAHHFYPQAK